MQLLFPDLTNVWFLIAYNRLELVPANAELCNQSLVSRSTKEISDACDKWRVDIGVLHSHPGCLSVSRKVRYQQVPLLQYSPMKKSIRNSIEWCHPRRSTMMQSWNWWPLSTGRELVWSEYAQMEGEGLVHFITTSM